MPPKIINTHRDQPQVQSSLHARLFHVATSREADPTKRFEEFRKIAIEETGAIGAFHLSCNRHGQFSFADEDMTDRVPDKKEVREQLIAVAQVALKRGRSQIQQLDQLENLFVVCCPVNTSRPPFRILGVIVPSSVGFLQATSFIVDVISAYNRLWSQNVHSADLDWQLQTTATLCELTTRTLAQPNRTLAAMSLVNELKTLTGAQQVAIALKHGRRPKLIAISGRSHIDVRNEQTRAILNALTTETYERTNKLSLRGQGSQALHHRKVLTLLDCEAVRTLSLQTNETNTIGAILLTGNSEPIASDRCTRFLTAMTPHLSLALQAVQEKEPSLPRRVLRSLTSMVTQFRGWATLVGVACVIALLSMPVRYRVQCRCYAEPASRRYVVAPLQGLLEQTFVKAGDQVLTGEQLARIDGRELRWELAGVVADRAKASKQRDIELANDTVAKAVLASLEEEQLGIREQLLRHQLSQLDVQSPIAGIVLSASFEDDQNAPLEKGNILFEIAPTENCDIEIAIPAEEVAAVNVGNQVSLWMEGLSTNGVTGTITAIRPQSETYENRNVFIAEIELETAIAALRPGMTGHARIAGEPHPLAWNLFHKPWEWCLSRIGY